MILVCLIAGMIFSRSLFFCIVFIHVLADPKDSDPPEDPPRYVALGETGAPLLNRIHRRQVDEEKGDDGYHEVKLRFTLSPLGQIFVQPTDLFPNLTETTTVTATPENNSTSRSALLGLGGLSSLESDLGLGDTHIGASLGIEILKRPIVGSYFPDWNLDVLSPEQIDYSKYDLINFGELNCQ